MNYIALLNGFREQRKIEPLTTNEITLWFILVEYCNEIGWIEWFNVANGVVQGLSDLSRSAFHRARNELARKGYIKYREGSGNRSGKYLIVDFGTQIGTQTGTQTETQDGHKAAPLYKPKRKPKTKEKSNKKKTFTPPTLDEVKKYCTERGNKVDPVKFYDYYDVNDWVDNQGNPVQNWKQKLITWEKSTGPKINHSLPTPQITEEQAKALRGR